MLRHNPDDELDLEALFESGVPEIEGGDLLPLPSMPLLEQEIPETPPAGPPSQETGEVTEIAPEIDPIRRGDIVQIPGGKKMKVQWVDPRKKRLGVGLKRKSNYLFFSFEEVERVSGKKVVKERDQERKKAAKEEGRDPPPPKDVPPEMPDLPINPDTGKTWLHPYQIDNVEFLVRHHQRDIAKRTAAGFAKGSYVRITSGPDAGAHGRIFWIGKSKQTGKPRYGFEGEDKQTHWVDDDQVEAFGVRWYGGLLADEMGLGKTLCAIVALKTPCVCVVPSLLKPNWKKEIGFWRPELSKTIISGTRPEMVEDMARQADVVIINYDVLHAHVDWLIARQNMTVIADEAHYLKTFQVRWNKESAENEIQMGAGKTTKRARAFHDIRFAMPEGGRPILLTGTPVLNRTKELFPLLYFIDTQTWGGKHAQYRFWQRYCGLEKTRFGINANGRSNTEELHERISGIFMMRHTKEEVLTSLPAKERKTKDVELSPRYKKIYRRAATDFIAWVMSNGGPEAVAAAMRAQTLVQLTKLRHLSAMGKVPATINYITEFFVSTQRPLVVMGVHKEAFSAIAEGLDKVNEAYRAAKSKGQLPPIPRPIRYGKVLGGQAQGPRQKAINDFQDHGTIDVLLYSIHIATGTTLTRSQDMVFFERLWRPADQVQAEDRIHRIGQQNVCKIVYLDGVGTIDAKLGMMLMNKATTAAGVIDGVDLSAEMASMLIFGEMMGMGGGFIDGLMEILDDASAIAGEGFDDEDLGSGDRFTPNPGHVDTGPIFDEDGDWIDTYGEELEPNPGDDEPDPITNEALDSWWDPL